MKLTIDQIPCDLDPSQRIALDYDAQDLAGHHIKAHMIHSEKFVLPRAGKRLGKVFDPQDRFH